MDLLLYRRGHSMHRSSPNGRLHLPSAGLALRTARTGRSRQQAAPASKAVVTVPPKPLAKQAPPIQVMCVEPHADGWALMVDDIDEPAWVVPKKRKALDSAKDAARHHRCMLRVLTRGRKLHRAFDFRTPGGQA